MQRLSKTGALALALAVVVSLSPRAGLAGAEKKSAAPSEEPTAYNNAAKNLLGGSNDVWSVAFSPDGKLLYSSEGYWDRPGGVSVWDLATRKRLRNYPEALGVASVAVSPDGKRLAWAGWTQQAHLYDLAAGREIAKLALDSVARVAFSPDGKTLASISDEGIVKIWSVEAAPRSGAAQSTKAP